MNTPSDPQPPSPRSPIGRPTKAEGQTIVNGPDDEEPHEDEGESLEELISEFLTRQRRGEQPTIDEYAERFPEQADEIREVFPAMLAMERLKQKKERTTQTGRVSLGPDRVQKLGEFTILRELGRGGMGIVYEALQESLNRRVALKLLPRQTTASDPHLVSRFRREATTAGTLHHPNIVPVFGVGHQDGFHYYVMQYIEGSSLDQEATTERLAGLRESQSDPLDGTIVDGSTPSDPQQRRRQEARAKEDAEHPSRRGLPPREVSRLGIQAAEALDYAHRSGILHRDIKPANLIVDGTRNLWIADFGLARALEEADQTRTGQLVGTLRYVPPERFRGEADGRSDLYSLGLTLYELLAGRPAYAGADRARLVQQITQGDRNPLSRLVPQAPSDLVRIIEKCIQPEVGRRYQTGAELAADLRRFENGEPIYARRVRWPERLLLWSRRNPTVAILSGVVAVLLTLLLALGTYDYLRVRRDNTLVTGRLAREEERRREAERTSAEAVAAMEKIFDRMRTGRPLPDAVGDDRLGNNIGLPSTEEVETLETLLDFQRRLATSGGAQLKKDVADATYRLAEIQRTLGHTQQAKTLYADAETRYRNLENHPVSGQPLTVERSRVAIGQGLSLMMTGDAETAQDRFREAERMLTAVHNRSADDDGHDEDLFDVRYELARAKFHQARPPGEETGPKPPPAPPGTPPPFRDQEFFAAESTMNEAIELLTDLETKLPNDRRVLHLLARCYLERLDGPPRQIESRQQKAITLLDRLRDRHPNDPGILADLARALSATQVGPPATVQANFRRAHQLVVELLDRFPPVPEHRFLKITIVHSLAETLRGAFRSDEATLLVEEVIPEIERLRGEFPDVLAYRLWHATLLMNHARSALVLKDFADAELSAADAVTLFDELMQRSEEGDAIPIEPERLRGMLWNAWATVATTLERQEKSGAEEARKQAQSHLKKMKRTPRRFGQGSPSGGEFNPNRPPPRRPFFGGPGEE